MTSQALDELLNLLPYFACLRPDERVRVAGRFRVIELAEGARHPLDPAMPQLFVVADGEVLLERGDERAVLFPGDTVGEIELVAAKGTAGSLTARKASALAILDRPAYEALQAEFPIVGLPLVAELGRELKWRNDLLREIFLARAEGLPPEHIAAMLGRRRRQLLRHRRHPLRRLGAALVRVVFTEPARRPAFWMFAGAVLALVSARTVVGMILRNGLQKSLFALIGTAAGNPIHVHHFNYGLLLVSLTGLLAMIPTVRRALRFLSFVFGFGLGLVVDEFALLWNLNPDYYQPSSRLAAALVVFALAQVVYFRAFYVSLGRRLVAGLFS